jgi:HEAT repeat protein
MNRQLIFALAVGIAIGTSAPRSDEPVSKEKPVSDWVRELKNKHAGARAEAANALGALGRKAESAISALLESLKDLHEFLDDKDKSVREAVEKALKKIEKN